MTTPSPSSRAPAASRSPSAGLALFVETLQEVADVLGDLDDARLSRLSEALDDPREDARRIDLLAAYYFVDPPAAVAAEDEDEDAARRRRDDRFALFQAGDGSTARDVVGVLGGVLDDLDGPFLERIGGDDGPLVLRSGDAVSPVVEDPVERRDTEEIDLDELGRTVETVSIRSLVRAANGLLRQAGVPRRLVALRGDATREPYLGVRRAEAERLFVARFLDEEDFDDVLDLAGWPE